MNNSTINFAESRLVWTVLIGLALWIASPFAVPLLAGYALALVSHPAYAYLLRRGLPALLSAILIMVVWAVALILPVWAIAATVWPVATHFSGASIPPDRIYAEMVKLPWIGGVVVNYGHSIMDWLEQHPVDQMIRSAEPLLGHVVGHSLSLIIHTALALIVAMLLLLHGERLAGQLRPHLFELIGQETAEQLERVMISSVRAVMLGMISLAAWEGVLGVFMFGFAHTPAAMIFAIALAISSLIPGGSGIVLALAAVVAYTQQDITHAIIILVVGHVITLSGDYIIKPLVTGAKSHAPFLLVLLSILGGVEVMGLIGLIAGPVIVLMLYGMVSEPEPDDQSPALLPSKVDVN